MWPIKCLLRIAYINSDTQTDIHIGVLAGQVAHTNYRFILFRTSGTGSVCMVARMQLRGRQSLGTTTMWLYCLARVMGKKSIIIIR